MRKISIKLINLDTDKVQNLTSVSSHVLQSDKTREGGKHLDDIVIVSFEDSKADFHKGSVNLTFSRKQLLHLENGNNVRTVDNLFIMPMSKENQLIKTKKSW